MREEERMMNTRVEFRSTALPKYPDENKELINNMRWGKRLAEWIRDNLPKHEYNTEEILCEDWGWLVFLENAEFPLWIGCGILDDSTNEFAAFVTAEPNLIQRWIKRVDTTPALEQASNALAELIKSHPDIDQVWWGN